MSKFLAAVEINRHTQSKDEQINLLTKQLREAHARNARAFDQGAAMVVRAIRRGAHVEEVATKIRWEVVDGPAVTRARTYELNADDTARIAIPMELEDSDEHTEPMAAIPLAALK